jgi:predicted permease
MRNLQLAFRTLIKTPFVATVAVLSLALGIGANAAIFSLFDQLLLAPLRVHQPARLVNLSAPRPKPGSQSCSIAGPCDDVLSYPMYRDLERLSPSPFKYVVGHRNFGANVAFHGQTLNGEGLFVSGSYFPALGIQPARGRLFTQADDQTIGGQYEAVLSYSYWQTSLGENPAVVGDKIVVNGQTLTIVGVAPEGFDGTSLGARPSVFVPLTMRGVVASAPKDFTNRRSYWVYSFARLQPGVTMSQAQTAVNAAYHRIINEVEAPLQTEMSAQTMVKFRAKTLQLSDGSKGQSSVRADAGTPMLMLFLITGIVLLIACANIANLLLARGANRATEMSVRLALGGSRRQLLAQLLTESLVLAAIGGAVSLVIAKWTIDVFDALLPADVVLLMNFHLSTTAIVFAAALAVGTGFMFGLFPALHSTRPDLASALRSGSGKQSGARSAARFRASLVTVQIALSMALLIAAGLFVKSLRNVAQANLGFNVENIVTFGVSPSLNGYSRLRSNQFFARAEQQLAAIPGVTGVTAGAVPLLAGDNWGNQVAVQGFRRGPDTDASSSFNAIAPGYFHLLSIPVIAGREFTASDVLGAPRVAIVNEAFARKFGLGRDAVGKLIGSNKGDTLNIEIVGLVKDAKYNEVKNPVPPVYFTPYKQDTTFGSLQFYVKTASDLQTLLRAIPPAMAKLDPNLPLEQIKTLPQQVKDDVFLDRLISTLSAGFAILATLLAAVGLYGMLAYSVAQRTREIGVRMALGANAGSVQRLVLRQVALMTSIGGAIGIAAAVGLGMAAQSLLFQLKGFDPWVTVASAAVLSVVALAAGWIPARRAARVDPMQALRYE